ncbi:MULTISPECIES: RNA polymerase factor sigma-32 [Brucella]|mgnify:CR=1 FL=1|jgi:RNA polymerase sigma-32 factor|uniref:RNA polymerase factor sigma-32 n=2 Tax=Brucella pseudogrignonensis TaxID=419475 RepID=A0A7Y3T6C6_9HYPH|nr:MULTISPECIES: RNA polymerase factor sigma-32 [Brucella]EMG53702.1 RNA polymerase factor sigma-32 [Ochrobactrum sp. CDB2]MBO1026226.1 RNA polymerase factor sigma-32 [Ochrobactrum sp. SD129]MQP42277.1 RNA polymerase factor sigma-32 [Ochrobactrum sp. MYb237]QWK77296.1 RNA polymerase factor sigma-32 [Ochrobactrum sp. BTU1]ANG96603.1 RNA polymerase factor sigma-32 [Brucella pseudogrignonensis]
MKQSSMSSSSTVPPTRLPISARSIQAPAASSQSMIRNAMSAPYLEREEERDLAIRWKENKDQDALHRITASHMRLVISMAGRFRKFKLPMSDLVQEGYVGLLEAAARFDPDREVRFSTYASWWIRASMQDYILRNWSIVRGGTSSAQKSLFFNLRRLRSKLAQEDETMSKADIYREISTQLGVSATDVEFMDSRLSGSDSSLSASMNNDESGTSTRMDFLVDDHPLQDEVVESTIDMERRVSWLHTALHALNERELHIIRERRLDDDGVTLEALGEKLGISKERVRQIESRAMEKLKLALLDQHEMAAYQA